MVGLTTFISRCLGFGSPFNIPPDCSHYFVLRRTTHTLDHHLRGCVLLFAQPHAVPDTGREPGSVCAFDMPHTLPTVVLLTHLPARRPYRPHYGPLKFWTYPYLLRTYGSIPSMTGLLAAIFLACIPRLDGPPPPFYGCTFPVAGWDLQLLVGGWDRRRLLPAPCSRILVPRSCDWAYQTPADPAPPTLSSPQPVAYLPRRVVLDG